MFWALLLSHLLADYPLQTDGMVEAKKNLLGLYVHVALHFITIIAVLCGLLDLSKMDGVILALAISLLHFIIDFWKNILSTLKPTWIIFAYIQDQILHIISLLLVAFVWQKYSGTFLFIEAYIIWVIGLLLVAPAWAITEKVFCHKNLQYQQWLISKSWARIVLRSMFYSVIIFGLNLAGMLVFIGAIIVSWFDLQPTKRMRILLIDISGVSVFMFFTWAILAQ